MASTKYERLRDNCSDFPEDLTTTPKTKYESILSRKLFHFLLGLLTCSIFFNAIWIFTRFRKTSEVISQTPTYYTGLVKEKPIPFTINSIYTHDDRTVQDAAWNAPELQTVTGLVALSDSYAHVKGLLPAQRWPWDHSKGIYIINAFHNLHCVHALRKTILEAYDGKPLSYPFEHIAHCLNVLREEVMCNADDTPRYTGRLNEEAGKEHPTSGIGQNRMCYDWTKLRAWANERSGCYKPINKSNPNFPAVDRYKFCPDGRVLWD